MGRQVKGVTCLSDWGGAGKGRMKEGRKWWVVGTREGGEWWANKCSTDAGQTEEQEEE